MARVSIASAAIIPPNGLLNIANEKELTAVTKVAPVYPPLARQQRVEGKVNFIAIIDAKGRVQQLVIVSGHPLLIPSAQEAVRQWVYVPTLWNGQPREVKTTIDVIFSLSQ